MVPTVFLKKRKARIVAKGYSQEYGRDYYETYAPVARLNSVRTVIALAAQENMDIRQYDITTAYLNGILDEEVYMEPPKWLEETLRYIVENKKGGDPWLKKAKMMFDDLMESDKVCRMRKALYGLKQAGRVWHERFDKELRALGATPTLSDPCIYLMKSKDEKLIIIVIYVDDILVMCQDTEEILKFGKQLSKIFNVKDIGKLERCLGMDFIIDEKGILVHHKNYIEEILERFQMSDCNPVSTPLDPGTKLVKDNTWQDSDGEKPPYRELVGCLLYLAISTRPDISHTASLLGQFNDCFSKNHWNAAKRVLRYLKGTKDQGIFYKRERSDIIGYVDADWAASACDRRSFSGFVFLLGGGAITWDSKKQRTVALSTTEAEYMAMAEAAKEIVHLRRFLLELGVSSANSINLCVDNMSAQKLASNPIHHVRTKHIDVRYHFIREIVKSKQINLSHVSSSDMLADVFTKVLVKSKHEKCIRAIGLSNDVN